MALDPKDLEAIERVVYKNADDIAVSISRSFERIEERVDAAESRLDRRLADVADKLEGEIHELTKALDYTEHD